MFYAHQNSLAPQKLALLSSGQLQPASKTQYGCQCPQIDLKSHFVLNRSLHFQIFKQSKLQVSKQQQAEQTKGGQRELQQSTKESRQSLKEQQFQKQPTPTAPQPESDRLKRSKQLLLDLQNEKQHNVQNNIPSIFYKDEKDASNLFNYSYYNQPQLQTQATPKSRYSNEVTVKEEDPSLKQEISLKSQGRPKTLTFNISDFSSAHVKPQKSEQKEQQEELSEEQQQQQFNQVYTDQSQGVLRKKSATQLEDGINHLQDGTTVVTKSGVEQGANGFQSKWTVVSGQTPQGDTLWEEKWWESSDWSGLKELGAEKQGCNAQGDAWREYWSEKICNDSMRGGEPVIIRNAEKRAKNLAGNEWEEKWYEWYGENGKVAKNTDKWTKEYDPFSQQDNIWHEKWGEDYDNGWCKKWTDRWSERGNLSSDKMHKWGEKWIEDFYQGKGHKYGEVWDNDFGQDYHRNWGENHFGEGWVQKWGNSNTGEQWDTTDQSGTYYNPTPHFGFDHAYKHSLELHRVKPRAGTPKLNIQPLKNDISQ